ncbi:hypothetical protein U8527_03945 [Kordia algicida OT-1]|uniref:Uncharacterized protein n=1 Tax=Kordia algicida OT-1 TaxID=391587 RepID=A9DPN1_9FLAO|nr:hypothetical protein [Kordia algicida]EDP97476.1 hypothetical protein KAOT1_19977 [Kordia algicida OT-1]
MEDFDYIDSLAKSELSDRTLNPSTDGWNMVQQKMKRQKRKRLFIYLFLLTLIGSLGIYIGVHSNTTSENTSVVNTKSNTNLNTNSDSTSTSDSNSISDSISNSDTIATDSSQAESNTIVTQTEKTNTNQQQTANNLHGEKNGIANSQTRINSRLNNENKNNNHNRVASKIKTGNGTQFDTLENIASADEEDVNFNGAGLKLYDWQLIAPDKLKKKRQKRKKASKAEKVYENLDLMVGFNGFTSPNDYKFSGSYVFEVSYTEEKKLKNDFYLNYGASLQFRNLRFKNDSLSFNRGELSFNILSSVEKRFGNYGVEAGTYLGYEFYSPNNELFNNIKANFLERKINYGLFTALNYQKIGLVFKYEFSPYINYLGDKKFGAFTIGVKYDF